MAIGEDFKTLMEVQEDSAVGVGDDFLTMMGKPKEEVVEPVEAEDEFTGVEKFITGALPIVGGIGAAIATGGAALPVMIGAGALGAGGGKFLGDIFESIVGGEKRSAEDMAGRALREGTLDAVFTVGTLGLGKIIKPIAKPIFSTLRTSLAKAAKPIIASEGVTKIIKDLGHAEKKLKTVLNAKRSEFADLVGKREIEVALEKGHAVKKLDELIKKSTDEISGPMSKWLLAGKQSFNSQYGKALKEFGDVTVPLSGKVLNKINGIDSRVLSKLDLPEVIGDVNLRTMETTRRELEGRISSLFRGTPADYELALALRPIKEDVADVMGQKVVGNGILKEVTKRYKDYSMFKDMSTKFKLPESRTLVRGKAGKALIEKGKLNLGAEVESIMKSARSTGEMNNEIKKKIADFMGTNNALRATGSPRLIQRAEQVDSIFSNIIDNALDEKKVMQEFGLMKESAKKLDTTGMLAGEIEVLEKTVARNMADKEFFSIAKDRMLEGMDTGSLLPVFIAGQTIASLPMIPETIRNPIRVIVGLVTLRKWTPKAAKSLLSTVKIAENKLMQAKGISETNRKIISRFLSSVTAYAVEE